MAGDGGGVAPGSPGGTGRRRWPQLLVLVALVVFPLVAEPIVVRRVAGVGVLSLAVLGLVVVTGRTGLISLGHGALVGLGAFAMASYLDVVGLPAPLALAATFVTCWAVGWLVGLPALRIRGLYLALVTLGVAVVFPSLAKRFPTLTGGVSGRAVESTWDAPAWLGEQHTVLWRYYWCATVCLVLFRATAGVLEGRMGRALRAVRDDETAAAAFGVRLASTKTGAFALSAALAGTAGALRAVLFPFVSHEQYDVFLSFRLYAAAVIGGIGELSAAVYGVGALILVPALNDAAGLLDSDVLAFGVGLVVLTFVAPDGLAGLVGRWAARLRARRRS